MSPDMIKQFKGLQKENLRSEGSIDQALDLAIFKEVAREI